MRESFSAELKNLVKPVTLISKREAKKILTCADLFYSQKIAHLFSDMIRSGQSLQLKKLKEILLASNMLAH
jgi:hypothetical protein